MTASKRYAIYSIVLVLFLCVAQVNGSSLLILLCLAAYLCLLCWCCVKDFTLPLLLFFLPWSQLLRLSPNDFSFYTVGMILVCGIHLLKRNRLRKYHIILTALLMVLTLSIKLIDGNFIDFDYITIFMLFLFFPVVKDEWSRKRYDFYTTVCFFALGIVLAAICAKELYDYGNIRAFIQVNAWQNVTRRSGFYDDPNFYTAQITAALGGAFAIILRQRKASHTVFLAALIILLLYCGMFSSSKSFLLITIILMAIWIVEVFRIKGRTALKVCLLVGCFVTVVLLLTLSVFEELWLSFADRLSYSDTMSDITTGRTDIWQNYLRQMFSDMKLLIFGNGLTKEYIGGRASHNTLLQLYYQFGLVGVPLVMAWIVYFYRDLPKWETKKRRTIALLLLIGSFAPWVAIDALFFDEFFLLQWYVFSGLLHFRTDQLLTEKSQTDQATQ